MSTERKLTAWLRPVELAVSGYVWDVFSSSSRLLSIRSVSSGLGEGGVDTGWYGRRTDNVSTDPRDEII